jgi:hypothetical protein
VVQAGAPLAFADDGVEVPEPGAPVVAVPAGVLAEPGPALAEPPAAADDDVDDGAVLELELAELHPAARSAATPSAAPVSDMRPCAVNVIGIPL